MRKLIQALAEHELIVLRVIGEWWELELTGSEKETAVATLAERLAGLDFPQELQFLPPEEAAAIQTLAAAHGRLPMAAFEREHGEVRQMGPGRLEREEPWFDPISPAEALWYRGFLYRGFDDTADGLLEFYFLPQELATQVVKAAPQPAASPVEQEPWPAAPPPANVQPAGSSAVDDLTTLLAVAQRTALRTADLDNLPQLLLNADGSRRGLLIRLAREMGLLRQTEAGVRPTRAAVAWLQSSREQQLRALAEAWSGSGWNELCHVPQLRCEGEQWQNQPLVGRSALLEALPRTPDWYAVRDLVTWFKVENPDFQRPDGNYDTWFIRDVETDTYLKGFDHWEKVEGRLLGFYLNGPLHWLGMVDTGREGGRRFFRLSDRGLEWLAGVAPAADEVTAPLRLAPGAVIAATRQVNRYARFQAARISDVETAPAEDGYRYRITPHSLARAQAEGITPTRILEFLAEAGGQPVPPSTRRCITRWAERGVEARLESVMILRVREAEILETLRQNKRTRDFIEQSLGDLAAVVRMDNWPALRAAAAELGLLLDAGTEGDGS